MNTVPGPGQPAAAAAPAVAGTSLTRRRGFILALVGCAALFTVAVASPSFRDGGTAGLVAGVVVGVLLVVVPLGAAWVLSRLRLYVSPAGMTSRLGRRGQHLAWADVTVIRVRWAPGVGAMPRRRTVTLIAGAPGPAPQRRMHASEMLFDLGPLLEEVLAQVAARPELLVSDEDRTRLAEFAAVYDLL